VKTTHLFILLNLLLWTTFNLFAAQKPVASMKSNSQINYFETPSQTDSISGMFQEGMFYGRLRSNTFYFWWNKEDTAHDIHLFTGVGGSLVYKSASLNGFDFGGALYYSYAALETKDDQLLGYKAGKDVFSRYNFINAGSKNMAVLGQMYMRYKPTQKSKLIMGRQIVESFYTKSNDTKMIPNTFDGVVLDTQDIDSTSVKIAYLAKQKLRDHIENHSVLMVGDANSSSSREPQWSENDDSAMHKGLTYTALKNLNKDTEAPLIIGDIKNKSVQNLSLNSSFYSVPKLISQVMAEINYKINFDGLSITPGIRYIKQFDNGAGAVGGASLKGDVSANDAKGYKNPTSLNSQMIAARIVARFDKYKINLAYTNILDEADLVTPWRGFPTSGYTRSMARYNWRANTKSYRLEVVRNTSLVGLYNDIYIQASVMYQDDDINKYEGIDTDSIYYYIGFMQNIEFMDNAQWRFRFGHQNFAKLSDINNIDTRFELNYFF